MKYGISDLWCSTCKFEENNTNPDAFSKCGQCWRHKEEGHEVQALGFTDNWTVKETVGNNELWQMYEDEVLDDVRSGRL